MHPLTEERQRLFSDKSWKENENSKLSCSEVFGFIPSGCSLSQKKAKDGIPSQPARLGSFGPLKPFVIALILSLVVNECHRVLGDQSAEEKKKEAENPQAVWLVKKPERKAPEIMPCGTTRILLPNEEMQIESPNFSQKMHYPNSLTCEWKFQFPGRMAKLSCPNFHLTEFLCFDSLEIHGVNGIMNRYCGYNGPKDLIISEEASITFRTSAFFGNMGFRCSIIGLDEEPETDGPVVPLGPPARCFCGISNPDKKVVMGIEAELNEFPWQAGLVRKNGTRPFCGGTLINDRYILTAAHCVVGRTPYNLEIILNVHNTEVGLEGSMPIRRSVEAITPHRRYTSRLDYDAALIKIDEPVDISHIPPVCLPQADDLKNAFANINATVAGWGLTAENGELSSVLRKATVYTMSNEECSGKYSSITDRMLCAAAPGTDACQGDSGGGLVYERFQKYIQVGIVSWGIGCARPNKPGVYTRVTEIMNWISKTSSEGSFCNELPPKFIGFIIVTVSIFWAAGMETTDLHSKYGFSSLKYLKSVGVIQNGTLNCACGEFIATTKSVDGLSIYSGDFPWLVGLIRKGDMNEKNLEPFCWGAIINDRYVLSEASCLFRKRSQEIAVFLFGKNVKSRKKQIENFFVHEHYNRTNHDNNLALLRLTRPLNFISEYPTVTPICLPDMEIPSKYLLKSSAIMTTRHYYKSVFHSSPSYYFASLPVHIARYGEPSCSNIFTTRPKTKACEEFGGTCYGERGSVLAMQLHFNKYIGIGIYSRGYGCNGYSGAIPADVSTDISRHVDWIMKHSSFDGKFCKQ